MADKTVKTGKTLKIIKGKTKEELKEELKIRKKKKRPDPLPVTSSHIVRG